MYWPWLFAKGAQLVRTSSVCWTMTFERNGVSWLNCISLGCDNANVMTGAKNGVLHFTKPISQTYLFVGCTLHLVHNAA